MAVTFREIFDGTAKTGEVVQDVAVLTKAEEKLKQNGVELYLMVTVKNKFGSMTFPVWEKYKQLQILEGKTINVSGFLSFYQDNPQLTRVRVSEETNPDLSYFAETYELKGNPEDEFKRHIEKLSDPYRLFVLTAFGFLKGSDEEVEKLRQLHPRKNIWAEFIKAPSAVKHHQNKIHGNLLHTLGVLNAVNFMISSYFEEPFPEYEVNENLDFCPDRLRAGAMLHDIMKVEDYRFDTFIEYKHPDRKSDHRTNGASYLGQINLILNAVSPEKALSDDDLNRLQYMLISHHGPYGTGVYEFHSLEDQMLHLADMMDSQIVGAIEKK